MNKEESLEQEDCEDLDFSELDSYVGDDAWAISFENTGSVSVDVDFFLQWSKWEHKVVYISKKKTILSQVLTDIMMDIQSIW